jgi:hypothetical protein
VNGFEHFGKKALVMFIVKKCKLFEAVRPSSCFLDLDEHLNCAQNGHEVNKIDFLRVHQVSCFRDKQVLFLFYILKLFPYLLKFGLDINDHMGQLCFPGLGPYGVDFPVQFLQQKIKLSTGRLL